MTLPTPDLDYRLALALSDWCSLLGAGLPDETCLLHPSLPPPERQLSRSGGPHCRKKTLPTPEHHIRFDPSSASRTAFSLPFFSRGSVPIQRTVKQSCVFRAGSCCCLTGWGAMSPHAACDVIVVRLWSPEASLCTTHSL